MFIAKDWGHQRNFSEQVAARVDAEIRRILEEQFARARAVIESDLPAMERVVAALIEYERITGEEFEKIYDGEEVQLVSYKERQSVLETADPEVLAAEEAERKRKEEEEKRRKEEEEARQRAENDPASLWKRPWDKEDDGTPPDSDKKDD